MRHGHIHKREDFIERAGFAQNCQPEHDALLDGRETIELFGEQVSYATVYCLSLSLERRGIAVEEINYGLGYDFQGQGIAPVLLDQLRLLRFRARYTFFSQQLRASFRT